MTDGPETLPVPLEGTLERWAWEIITTDSLARKLSPGPAPTETDREVCSRRLVSPSRPGPLRAAKRSPRTPSPEALREPSLRARLLHTFVHHELQAAELMAWAILAWPDAPSAFRRGLSQIVIDELRHVELYASHMASLGVCYGDLPVRDWFWERIPAALTPAGFVATMGVGLEGANLDHCSRFARLFTEAGDPGGARVIATVGEEELPHVRFALYWLKRFSGVTEATFALWAREIVEPLSPWVLRGRPVDRDARRLAGFDEEFITAIENARPVRPLRRDETTETIETTEAV